MRNPDTPSLIQLELYPAPPGVGPQGLSPAVWAEVPLQV
jgi:hypothetical protein